MKGLYLFRAGMGRRFILIFALMAVLSGCHSEWETSEPEEGAPDSELFYTTQAIAEDMEDTDIEPEPDPTPLNYDGPGIMDARFINDTSDGLIDVSILYPQLYLYPDQELQDHINRQIYDFIITEYMRDWKGTRIDIQIEYETAIFDGSLLSVVFSGYQAPTSKYNDFKEALTFDLNTGEKLDLCDFFSASEIETLIEDFMEGEECQVKIGHMEENLPIPAEELKELFLEKFKNAGEAEHKNDFYIKENGIGLMINLEPYLKDHASAEFYRVHTPALK